MNLTSFATHYLTFNILIAVGSVFSFATYLLNQRVHFIRSSHELKFNYFLMAFIIMLSLAQSFLPKEQFFKPPAKVWSASTDSGFEKEFSANSAQGYLSIDLFRAKPIIDTKTVNTVFWWVMVSVLLFGLYRLRQDINSLIKLSKKSFLIRQVRRIRILSSDLIKVPFSFRLGRTASVVVPNSMLGTPEDLRFAVFHELQHHRQRDTLWVHLLWLIKIICCLNPCIYLWSRIISEVQEFACDEALVDRKKVSSVAYASCLVRVAQTAVGLKRGFVCATGLTFMADRHSLKRRIKTMMVNKPKNLQKSFAGAAVALAVIALTAVAMASQGVIQDRRITLAEAQNMLAHVRSNSDFQVVVNDLVLKELNHYVGTPDGRDFMKQSLARMSIYQAMVKDNLTHYNVPQDLIVIPIVESGYQNLAQPPHQLGAGLWMFIASTAENYGLQVNARVDERLNEPLLTDAAMRYLTANHLRFKSWELSVLAYNIGENKVQQAIDATGSREAFTLIRAGYEGDPGYLAKVMATVLIKDNPSVLL